MSGFHEFKIKIQEQFKEMAKHDLFVTAIEKDLLWDTYLGSFPEGTNPIYKERTEHDCQCCKQFIRACGNVVAITHEGFLMSIWDIKINNHYQDVADALSASVKTADIKDVFLHYQEGLGTDYNHQNLESGDIKKWEHFHFNLPATFVQEKDSIGGILSAKRTDQEVLLRSLDTISIEAAETVLELIAQNSLYKGEEHESIVRLFLQYKKEYDQLENNKDSYCWSVASRLKGAGRIRNTAIGVLLVDLSEGREIDPAVRTFETIVAPANYQRPKTIATASQIADAQKDVGEMGYTDSLATRYAAPEDLTINNVLFADRSAKKVMDGFDELIKEVPISTKKLGKVEDVSIETFVKNILPQAESIELLVENKHANNFVSLIAPVNPKAKNMLKWLNNFRWSYRGEMTDSMKERIKKAGGNVTGILRFSIQWNDGDNNQNDFDAHCIEPNRNLIYYSNKGRVHPSSGILDVDIQRPGEEIAVENITWSNIDKIQEGKHQFLVHNFSHNGGRTGFIAEIEYDGHIYSYTYNKELRQDEKVVVAEIDFNKETGIKFIKSLPEIHASKEVWNIQTHVYQKVSMIMNSPNHWDGNKIGNMHYFFMLEDCRNPDSSRGFYNEFLNEDLKKHRKTFEMLGSKMRTEVSDNQLSGLGFSSTQRNSVLCKVTGSFSRIIKINF